MRGGDGENVNFEHLDLTFKGFYKRHDLYPHTSSSCCHVFIPLEKFVSTKAERGRRGGYGAYSSPGEHRQRFLFRV